MRRAVSRVKGRQVLGKVRVRKEGVTLNQPSLAAASSTNKHPSKERINDKAARSAIEKAELRCLAKGYVHQSEEFLDALYHPSGIQQGATLVSSPKMHQKRGK